MACCPSRLQKYLPIDLRTKKTRAIRRRLTPYQVRHLLRQPKYCMLAAHVFLGEALRSGDFFCTFLYDVKVHAFRRDLKS